MALIHADSFDIYGTTTALLTEGIYTIATGVTLFNTPRTGAEALVANTVGAVVQYSHFTSGKVFGIGYAVNLLAYPTVSGSLGLMSFHDVTNTNQISFWVTPAGTVEARRGDQTGPVLATSTSAIPINTYTYVEAWVGIDPIDGYVRLGIGDSSSLTFSQINLTGIDTDTTGTGEVSAMDIFNRRITGTPGFYIDDLAIYDALGATNNAPFIGDSVVLVMSPNADTANADWAKSTGSDGFALVDGIPPDDSNYISTATPNATSRFALSDLSPTGLYRVRGVVVYSRQELSTAGTATTVVSMKNDLVYSNGVPHVPTTTWTYYKDVFSANSVAALNTASIQIKKVAN